MNFLQLLRAVDTDNYTEKMVKIDKIKAQYNPNRFKLWQSVYKGPAAEVLNMIYSPHYRLLKGNQKPYYQMQRLYGRNDRWIKTKADGFIKIFESIRDDGMRKNITILRKPLVENKHNDGFEIFEGHHRLACCLVLGMTEITCNVIGDIDGK